MDAWILCSTLVLEVRHKTLEEIKLIFDMMNNFTHKDIKAAQNEEMAEGKEAGTQGRGLVNWSCSQSRKTPQWPIVRLCVFSPAKRLFGRHYTVGISSQR